MEVLNRQLMIMDQTAITLCMDNKIDLCVFNMQQKGNIARAVNGEKNWNNNHRRKIICLKKLLKKLHSVWKKPLLL